MIFNNPIFKAIYQFKSLNKDQKNNSNNNERIKFVFFDLTSSEFDKKTILSLCPTILDNIQKSNEIYTIRAPYGITKEDLNTFIKMKSKKSYKTEYKIIENNKEEETKKGNSLQTNDDINMKDVESHSKKVELLDKMIADISFSDSEEEDQKDNNKQPFVLDENNYKNEMSKINKLYEQNQEEGVDDGTMNKYTGTRHEIVNEKERKDYPIPFEVTLDDKFEECGIVKNIIDNEILMTGINNNVLKVLNLDNIIFLPNKKYLGFIDDVIGQIDNPIYAIKIYPDLLEQKINEKINPGDKLFFCSNRAKVINAIELKNKSKGCDASNAFDEEVSEGEKDYSDDEEEVQAKIRKKNNKKNKKKKTEENIININNITDNLKFGSNIGQNSMLNAPYSSENLNKSKQELDKKMDIFVNNAMNMNINPFSSPFGGSETNQINNNILNNNINNNL